MAWKMRLSESAEHLVAYDGEARALGRDDASARGPSRSADGVAVLEEGEARRTSVAEVRLSASTIASSSAMAAPSAMLGDVACAASPMSSTGPRDQDASSTSSMGPSCSAAAPLEDSSSRSSRPGTGSAYPARSSRNGVWAESAGPSQ